MTEHNLSAAFEMLFGYRPTGSDEVYDFDRDVEPVTESEAAHMQRIADSRTVDMFGIGAAS